MKMDSIKTEQKYDKMLTIDNQFNKPFQSDFTSFSFNERFV